MQTTLDFTNPSVAIDVEPKNSTLEMSDEHIEHLWEHSSEGIIAYQIEQHLAEEEGEAVEIKRRYEEFLKHEKPSKSQEYIRVGKR